MEGALGNGREGNIGTNEGREGGRGEGERGKIGRKGWRENVKCLYIHTSIQQRDLTT